MLKFIFLSSSNYSGSTLLASMINCHDRIVSISELTGIIEKININQYQCSCGKIINNCDFWKEVLIRMKKNHKNFSLKNFGTMYIPREKRLIDRLQFSNLKNNKIADLRDFIYSKIPQYNVYLREITKRNIDLANTICDVTKKDIFFDASKRPQRIKFLQKNLKCEFKVVHLVKDGRGVFDSYKRYNPKMPDSKAILIWKNTNLLIERSLKYVKKENRYFMLYKSLVTDPEAEMKKLSKFIGVPYSPKFLSFKDCDHHIIGNTKMRLKSNNKIYYDDKWKESLSKEQLKLFNNLAGKINRKYGFY